jgi:TM2 domain-containing membrane protein YozV
LSRKEFSLTGLMRFSLGQIIGALAVLLIIWLVIILRLLSSHA